MLRTAPPQIVRQQSLELRRDEAHLRRQLHPLLAQVEKIGTQSAIEKHDRFPAQDSILRAAEGEHIHAEVARSLA